MKKIISFSFILLFFEGFRAQNFAPLDAGKDWGANPYYYYGSDMEWMPLLGAGKKVKTVATCSSRNTKDNQFLMMNEQGKVIERKEYHFAHVGPFWKRIYFHEKLEYNNGLESQLDFYNKKGQLTDQTLYEYFSPHKLKRSVFMHKGVKRLEKTAEFNADSNITSFVSYKFKKGKPVQKVRYEYEYYPDKQNKETRMYNSHNKIKYVWKYDCNPKGEIKKENELQVCKNTTTDNRGRLVETTFNTNSKGRKTKVVNTYYMFGGKKVQAQMENYIIEKGVERKVNEMHFADSLEKYYVYTNYDRKGRISYQSRTEYSVYNRAEKIRSLTTTVFYSRSRPLFKTEQKFNEKGMPLGSTVTNKRGKIIGRTEFTYQDDTQYVISLYNKKQKLNSTFTTKIQYY
jgi:hypothetical protein